MNKYERRLKKLCKKYKIKVITLTKSSKGHKDEPLWASSSAETETNIIEIAPLKGKNKCLSFACALHEIGHILSFRRYKKKEKAHRENQYDWSIYHNRITLSRLQEEFHAWCIAKFLAKNLWNYKMSSIRAVCISDYISLYESDKRNKSAYLSLKSKFKYFHEKSAP